MKKTIFYNHVVDVNNMVLWYNLLRCPTGNNGNAGTSTGSLGYFFTYAMGGSSPVAAGDTVYVKAGNYGNENIVCTKKWNTK